MAVFFFTDIEGSTEKWERYRDVMGQVIARHNQILEQVIAGFGGKLIKHTGDGVFVIFDGALAATDAPLRCGVEIQRQIQNESWPSFGELRIRMAFHSGEAEEMKGDYYGPVANRTARLLSLGWGGQILVSEEMKKHSALPPGALLQDLGVHQVKDLPEPQQVYGLIYPSLKLTQFPPLKSLSDRPHNLPEQLTSFVGREKELAQVAAALSAPNTRLLTVRGAGGMGKTRLCIQAGVNALGQFKHGVYFAALESLNEPGQIVAKLADSLRIPLYAQEDSKTQLLAYLREKELLLILDNFDQLLGGVGLLSELLQAAPKLRLLVSCRSRLNHGSETVFELLGMDQALDGTPLQDSGAGKVFMQRARMVNPGFALKREDEPVLRRIAELLEGMPLGLELAAAWVRTLPLKEIARRLETNLALLISTEKDLPERQRSMRALFDYSWRLLSSDEQRLLQQLSAFVGGFAANAAQGVAQASHEKLVALVNRSLLAQGEGGRYFVPETLRPFAQAKLDAAIADKQRVLEAHARYYCQLLKAHEPGLRGQGQLETLEALRPELGNLRRAWKLAVDKAWAKQLGLGARSLGLLVDLLDLGLEWQALLEQALALWGGSELRPFEGVSTEEAIKGFATLSAIVAQQRFDAGQLPAAEAARALERSIQNLTRLQARDEAALCLMQLSGVATTDAAKAACLNDALLLYRQAGDKNGEAWARAAQGRQLWTAGQRPEGKRALGEALAAFEELGNQREEARSLRSLGLMSMEEGDVAGGADMAQAAKGLFGAMGDRKEAAATLLQLGSFFVARRQWKEALPYMEEALKAYETLGHERGAQAAMAQLSTIYGALGDADKALALLELSLGGDSSGLGRERRRGRVLLEKAELLGQQGRWEEQMAVAGEALRALQDVKDAEGAAEAIEAQGDAQLGLGQALKARDLYRKANQEFSIVGAQSRPRRAWSFVRLAQAETALGHGSDALKNLGKALNLVEGPELDDFAVAALAGLAESLSKEKKHLDALRLLLLCERAAQGAKLAIHRPRAYDSAREAALSQLSELDSKLLQTVVEETRAWAKGANLAQVIKDTASKYRA